MSQSRLTYLFNRYITKAYTPEEKAELFRLIQTEEADEELKALLGNMVEGTETEMHLPENTSDKIFQAIVGEMPALPVNVPVESRRSIPRWVGIAAASVVLAVLCSYFIFRTNKTGALTEAAIAVKNAGPSFIQITTTTREGKNIRLPDSTEVWLSPSSVLEYPPVFTGALREIKLSGEAFFEVAHDRQHPFIIHSGNIETRVLGTSFNIQAYDNQEEINVTVVTGKVNVSNKSKVEHVELVANQRAVFHRTTTELVKEEANTASAPIMLKRKDGEFVYKNERLQKVIDDLHEYFGINIQVAEAVKACPVNLNFYLSEKIEEVLEPISLMINGSVQKKGDIFFIDGKPCIKTN
ncbi:hypothetical protein DC498_13580 [Terrimonas sp.]|nr:hypothetical protein DC498_13580 [Terrimonas sp.]